MKQNIIKILKNPFVANLLLAGLITLVLLGVVMAWLNSYTRHNEAVVVPDVKGLKRLQLSLKEATCVTM